MRCRLGRVTVSRKCPGSRMGGSAKKPAERCPDRACRWYAFRLRWYRSATLARHRPSLGRAWRSRPDHRGIFPKNRSVLVVRENWWFGYGAACPQVSPLSRPAICGRAREVGQGPSPEHLSRSPTVPTQTPLIVAETARVTLRSGRGTGYAGRAERLTA